MQKATVVRALTLAALCAGLIPAAQAAEFDWTKYKGTTITFLANNNAVGNAVAKHKAEFEKLTGMTLKVDTYQEQQMRQRLVTVLNARSDEVDVFMTLVSREGEQFAQAGWYADLAQDEAGHRHPTTISPDSAPPWSPPPRSAASSPASPPTSKVPVIYYRKDVFAKCGVTFPTSTRRRCPPQPRR